MKRRLLLFLSLIFFISLNAQIKKRYNRSFIGMNLGATFEQSDVKDIAHAGWGFTFGKYYFQNETNMFDFGWRLRYLNGNTSGQDGFRNADLKDNSALNGIQDSTTDYFHSGGYVYNNYQMKFNEGAFEVMLGLNRLREKTRIVFYAFGGIGASGWQTKTNQLNSNGKRYAYDSLGTSPSLSAIDAMLDDSYETGADGNSKMKVHVVPSVGLGLGWQTKRGHYIGLEHRMTFTLNDYTDGIVKPAGGFMGGSNDLYHYGGFFIRWMIGGGTSTYHTTDPTGYSPPPPPPPTYTGTPTYTTTVVSPPPPPPPPPSNTKPAVVINYPNMNPYNTSNNIITVTAAVFNVGSKNDIAVKVNGSPSPNFAYDMSTKALTITSQLSTGNNSFYISAVNPYGSDYKSVNVIYDGGGSSPLPQKPIVTISYPSQNPFTTSQNNITVTGTVVNVSSKNEITAYINNVPNGTFTYDVNTKIISLKTNLNPGSNTVKFNATNSAGSDSKTQTIIYSTGTPPPPPPPSPKPLVTITSPSPGPYHTNVSSQTVYATVQNVNSQNEISVAVNGASSVFSYDSKTKTLMVAKNNLNIGDNIFTVSASNSNGSDSKSVTVIYANKGGAERPIVTITSPTDNPHGTKNNSISLTATVMYVASQNDISVKKDNQPFTNFSYNTTSKILSLTAVLHDGSNVFTITGTNPNGSDTKTTTVVYTQKIILPKPSVIINSPANSAAVSQNSTNVTATVLNVNSKNEITVQVNKLSVADFNYSPDSKAVTFNAPLNSGSNNITVSASNSGGSDSKSITVNYKAPVELPKPIVTITSPATNPFISHTQTITITATVLNVSSKNDIKVTTMGNTSITDFTYDAPTKVLSFTPTLMPSMPFTITATNAQGSDSKSITVKYVKQQGTDEVKPVKGGGVGIGAGKKPVVTILNPSTNPAVVTNPTVNFRAKVEYINSQSDIKVTLNGNPFTNFTYDATTHIVTFTATMPLGANNVVIITGTNPAGSDSKSVTINAN